MTPVALIFPGQGAQKVGMGAEFFQTSPQAKAIFDEADSILKNGLTDVIFNGPQEKLTLTAYCQPAILSMSVAALKAFQSHPKFQSIDVKFTAGLSLGEYGALVASGALSFADDIETCRTPLVFYGRGDQVESRQNGCDYWYAKRCGR
jgi:[acyl-carrier-protein] S-malonyltransferase